MSFILIHQDITKMDVDAIVNAANTSLQMGGGVCGAIFKAAGVSELQAACDKLAPIQTGDAVITPGFKLPAKYIIHTAGPIYRDGKHGEERKLRSCYLNSLRRAVENDCKSIAFPLISSGIYGYPKDEALRVATEAIIEFLEEHDLDVYLVIFDKATLVISEKLLREVERYLSGTKISYLKEAVPIDRTETDDLIIRQDEPFFETLLRWMDEKGKTDVEVYKRANLDRTLFSKISTSKDYIPSKRTVIALAVALELSLDETNKLLKQAGYALLPNQKFDMIVEYFIVNGKYDIYEINEVLFLYDQPILGVSDTDCVNVS